MNPGTKRNFAYWHLWRVRAARRLRGKKMARTDDYARYAAECVRVALKTPNPRDKAMLLDMAQRWRELARKLEAEDDNGAGR